MAKKSDSFFGKELWGMVLMLVSAFLLFSLITGNNIFYPVGGIIKTFLLGAAGYFSFPLLVMFFGWGLMSLSGKKISGKRGAIIAAMVFICLFGAFAITHLAKTPVSGGVTSKEYLSAVYSAGEGGFQTSTIGGVIFGATDYWLVQCLSVAGTYIVWILVLLLSAFVALKCVPTKRNEKTGSEDVKIKGAERGKRKKDDYDFDEYEDVERGRNDRRTVNAAQESPKRSISDEKPIKRNRTLVVGNSDFEMRTDEEDATVGGCEFGSKKRNSSRNDISRKNDDLLNNGYSKTSLYSDEYDKDFESKLRYVKSGSDVRSSSVPSYDGSGSQPYDKRKTSFEAVDGLDESGINGDIYMPKTFKAAVSRHAAKKTSDFKSNDIESEMEEVNNFVSDDVLSDAGAIDLNEPLIDETKNDRNDYSDYEAVAHRKTESLKPEQSDKSFDSRQPIKPTVEKKSGAEKPEKPQDDGESNPFDEMPLNFKYNAPPLDLLKSYSSQENYGEVDYFKRDKATKIINTLKVLGGVEVSLANIVHGPTVTRFDIAIPDNVSIKSILKYTDDLKLRLETKNDIRITPIPGSSLIGIEVANDKRSIVGLKDVIQSEAFTKTKKTSLTFAIGKDIVGNPVVADLTKTLHMLIAGASGTGKSVGLNSLLVSWFYKYSPADLRLIIVDPKLVEFKVFEGIPHLLFGDIITDAKTAVAMLNWAVKEMEARYTKMAELVVHNIDEYNDLIDPRKDRKLPKIVIIIDEFADLMSTDKKAIEEKIGRLAQKARAAGMYLILATQRPSVNIIEGSIKTNFISRMAFKMSNAMDSSTIIGESGAEKLLGNGDLLYRMSYMSNMERAQGAYIDMEEIKSVVAYIKNNNKAYFNEAAMKEINGEANPQIESVTGAEEKVPDYYIEALKIAVEMGSISISLIQRRLKSCGFPKAAKIFDWMVAKGYVLNSQGGKQKQVTLSQEEFDELYGDYDV